MSNVNNSNSGGGLGGGMSFRPPPRPSVRSLGRKSGANIASSATSEAPGLPASIATSTVGGGDGGGDDIIGGGDAAFESRTPGADLTNHSSVKHRHTPSYSSTASSAHAQFVEGKPSSSHGHGRGYSIGGVSGVRRPSSAAQAVVPMRSSSVTQGQQQRDSMDLDGSKRAISPAPSIASSAASSVYEDSAHGHSRPGGAAPSSSPSRPSSSTGVESAAAAATNTANVSGDAQQTVAIAAECRALLESLRTKTEDQAHSAGMLGQGILHQQTVVQNLLDDLADEVNAFEAVRERDSRAPGHSNSVRQAQAENERIRRLKERIEDEVSELNRKREELYREVWRVAGTNGSSISGYPASQDASFASSYPSNSNIFSALPGVATFSFLGHDPTVGMSLSKRDSLPAGTGSGGAGSAARQADRRSRNAAAAGGDTKIDDAFVRQIQESLLTEVRRLQAENKELQERMSLRDKEHAARFEEVQAQHALEEHKLKGMVRDQELLKAEAYDAELARQNAEEELHNIRTSLAKSSAENQRLERDLLGAKEKLETQKALLDEQSEAFTQAQTRRDKEIAALKKDKITLKRDHSELQSELEKVRNEQQQKRLYPRSVSNSLAISDRSLDAQDYEDDDADANGKVTKRRVTLGGGAAGDVLISPGGAAGDSMFADAIASPLGARLTRDSELGDLRAKLGVAQRKAGKDAADRRKHREQIAQLKALLAKAGINAGSDVLGSDVESSEEDDDGAWLDNSASPTKASRRKKSDRLRLPLRSSTKPMLVDRLSLAFGGSRPRSIVESGEEEYVDAESAGDHSSSALDHSSSFHEADSSHLHDTPAAGTAAAPAPARKLPRMSEATVMPDASVDSTPDASVEQPVRRPRGRKSMNLDSSRNSFLAAGSPAALGAELLEVDMHDVGPAREMVETGTMTDALPDLVHPALARREHEYAAELALRDEQHAKAMADTLAEKSAQHRLALDKALASKDAEHLALLDSSLDKRSEEHRAAIAALTAKQAELLEAKQAVHDAALSERDAAYQSVLADALTEKGKAHDAALADARLRHANALAEQVAASSSALAAAEAAHTALLSDAKKQHTKELQTLMEQHASELNQKDAEHEDHIQDVHASHSKYMAQRDAAYNTAISDRDTAIREAHEHVQRLTDEVNSLRNQLVVALREVETSKEAHAVASKRLLTIEKDVTSLTTLKATLEAQKTELESSKSALADQLAEKERLIQLAEDKKESDERFEDANAELHPSVASHTLKRASDVKDEAIQTYDVLWKQQTQQSSPTDAMFRPESALAVNSQILPDGSESTIGGGITILGGLKNTRPRDSVSTFGGARDPSGRAASPTPTMFTVGAILSHDTQYNAAAPSATVDKTKPPVMTLPPPPVLPPPPGIPPKRSQPPIFQQAPPRPTSPPPPELLHRLQTRSTLQVPNSSGRLSTTRNPPPSSYVPPSTSAMRASGTRSRGPSHDGTALPLNHSPVLDDNASMMSGRRSVASRRSASRAHARRSSVNSFASDATSEASHRMSISSQISEDAGDRTFTAPRRNGSTAGPSTADSADPSVINAITQTMIGSYLYKYTRKSMGRNGHSDKRHQRYFWVHPYTRMLYWTVTDPGGTGVTEGKSKSACIEAVEVVEDQNPSPPGLFHLSILVRTAAREMKITAPNRERHEVWLSALGYLVNRTQSEASKASPSSKSKGLPARSSSLGLNKALSRDAEQPNAATITELGSASAMPQTRGRGRSIGANSLLNGSVSKRRGIPARDYLKQQEAATGGGMDAHVVTGAVSPTPAPRSLNGRRGRATDMLVSNLSGDDAFETLASGGHAASSALDPRLQTAEQMLEEDHNNSWDGLDNVRACCDGKHDVASLAHRHHHHHHGSNQQGGGSQPRATNRLHKRWSSGGASLRSGHGAGSENGHGSGSATSPVPQVSLTLPRESFERSLRASGDSNRPRYF
ncbi:hypothetical protein K437DRAFT_294601 [Tilletiaria anomala UBC 951]|uniref:PH domain-containing protein n=1 Tax=Tilletiaria anomala (strain ATCC 24038 / CBS 436.72 / UBC 951) TaxID=1037660 RepID=A0A066VV01_TILAU|nr:uncharacterized protein K437DRAFT_294601 [Tilletiaria anomala UBC 951]KDN45306.1 hypothetical protein K437DRAFT_294601 [Tilletiaria anomala UBC 951]